MRSSLKNLFIFLLLVPASLTGTAYALEGLPGSSWGMLNQSVNGLTGSSAMGYINQGIDWTVLPGDIMLNTYGEYRYRDRTKQNTYFNAQGPALGLELKKSFLRLGADYYWERFPELGQRSRNREIYLRGYYDWDLSKLWSGQAKRSFPGSVWFNLTLDMNGLTGSGAMGYVNQGVDWFRLPGGIVFNSYAEYRYRSRTKQNDYYNAYGPVVGLEFKKSFLRAGADYFWENFPELNQRSDHLELYLTWYIDWDLAKKK